MNTRQILFANENIFFVLLATHSFTNFRSVIPVRRIVFEVFELAKLFFINFTGWFSLFAQLLYGGRYLGPFRGPHEDGTIEDKKIIVEPVPWGQISLLAFSTYPIIAIPSLADIMWSVFMIKRSSKILNI